MHKNWLRVSSPVAFLAGALLVHCSSSSSTSEPMGDGGTTHSTTASSGSEKTSGTTQQSGTSAQTNGSSVASGQSGTTGASEQTSATMTGASTGSGETVGSTPCPGGPVDGFPCKAGAVACGGDWCDVSTNVCCESQDAGSNVCQPSSKACAGNKIECEDKTACSSGQVCCLDTNVLTQAFTITCKTSCGTTGLGNAQICTTNAECPKGTCSVYSCQGQQIEACEAPGPSADCMMVGQVIDKP